MRVDVDTQLTPTELLDLYNCCGWNEGNWRRVELVQQAIDNSTLIVTARMDQGQLVGCARVVGDNAFVNQMVDVMVEPTHRGQGIATMIIERVKVEFPHDLMLIDGSGIHRLYEKMGFARSEREGVYYLERVDV
jgi:GNAT superfamily N-acetyltransferase